MRDSDESDYDEFFAGIIGRAVASADRVLQDHAAAEDAAVEALARAHLRWGKVRTDPHREAWVLRVAINVALDQRRGDRRRRRREERSASADAGAGFDGASDDRMALAGALRSLPERQREAVTLRYLADLPEAEVAATMGVSAGSIKVHLHRGLNALSAGLVHTITEEVPDAHA